jgi:ABC-type nitrate/sulfonate/bicarbonate transport system ATPase subunit
MRSSGPAPTDSPLALSPLMEVDGVGFSYSDGLRAVGDVSFDVQRGEIVTIIGPSGCGKSTLLRMLSGLREPTDGQIGRAPIARDRLPCTMVFQEETLLPWLRVKDNVALGSRFNGNRLSRAHRAAADARAHDLLRMVGLSDFANSWPSKLSGGMKRRVAVLTALAPTPELLLLDEPFSALDEPTRIGVHRDVYALLRQCDMSAVLVTHDLSEAITFSDRVLLLSRAPSRIVKEYSVPFPRERDMFDMRRLPEYQALYATIWKDFEVELKATTDVSAEETLHA